jgi:hypothetical protein
MGDSETFVARIWLESGADGGSTWRGHIRHVQGEREAYFQDLREMSEFLESVSGVRGPAVERVAEGKVTPIPTRAAKRKRNADGSDDT